MSTQTLTVSSTMAQAITIDAPIPPLVERLKGLACYAIIWIHVPRSDLGQATTSAARFAVPFFVALSVLLVVHTTLLKPHRSFGDYLASRFRRIYVPFLAWTALYLAFKGVKRLISPHEPNDFPGWEVLLIGSAYHLWFLPFIFVVSNFFFLTAQTIRRFPRLQPACLFVLVIAGWLVALQGETWTNGWEHDAFRYMVQALPAALFAGAFGISYCRGGWRYWSDPSTALIVVPLFVLCAAIGVIRDRIVLLESLSGVTLLLAACTDLAPAEPGRRGGLSNYSYGVYLVHLMVIKVLETVCHKIGWGPQFGLDLAVFAVTAVVSTLSVKWLLRSPATRWLMS